MTVFLQRSVAAARQRLNPCYNGIGHDLKVRISTRLLRPGLNPCYNGIGHDPMKITILGKSLQNISKI